MEQHLELKGKYLWCKYVHSISEELINILPSQLISQQY